jgi:hypothetical protein
MIGVVVISMALTPTLSTIGKCVCIYVYVYEYMSRCIYVDIWYKYACKYLHTQYCMALTATLSTIGKIDILDSMIDVSWLYF